MRARALTGQSAVPHAEVVGVTGFASRNCSRREDGETARSAHPAMAS